MISKLALEKGKDHDSDSETLKLYQQLLWSKPLPNGEVMQLGVENVGVKFGGDK